MDLTKIDNIETLKALGYDAMASLEQAQANLRMINQRIAELTQNPSKEGDKPKK